MAIISRSHARPGGIIVEYMIHMLRKTYFFRVAERNDNVAKGQ